MSAQAAFLGDVSRETIDRLQALSALIAKWTKTINLVSARDIDNLWDRHVVDSAQILEFAPDGWESWVDIGSGAGLPGLVVAAFHPERQITLIDSDTRKALFLKTASRELGLNTKVVCERIEKADRQNTDILSARALAPLTDLMSYASRHLAADGVALFLKGQNVDREIEEAKREWVFDLEAFESKTDVNGRILKVRGIQRRDSRKAD